MRLLTIGAVGVLVVLAGCTAPQTEDAELNAALQTIQADDLADDIRILSSDEFEGRGPSSPGEEKTIEFLRTEFRKMGLEPGNGDSYFQEVPLVSITADPDTTLTIAGGAGEQSFSYGPDVMAWTKRVVQSAAIEDSEMVFVGYGTVAPEYGWDDYAGIDVTGKTVVILVNDPGYATQDEALFNGNTMTYYGRWTYKYEEAARQGAAAALIVHETAPAAYGWTVVEGSWSGPQFGLVPEDDNLSRVAIEGWMTLETATAVFRQADMDYESLRDSASVLGFRPKPMGLKASMVLKNTLRRSTSRNVLATLPGTDRADEYVIYMAHWDHLGKDDSLEGDGIYNGALDNATGTANLIELAEAFLSLDERPRRSLVFLATTAEEQGLLGSAYYADNPVYPPAQTVAAINMDGANIWGSMKDVTVIGLGMSELDDYITDAADAQGRTVRPDPEGEKGLYYRSDHFELAKKGIPALYTDSGTDHHEHGTDWSMEKRKEYTSERYHKPSDEFDEDWDLSGAVDDVRLFFRIGYRLAGEDTFPNWRDGTEFKAMRDTMITSLQTD